MYENQTVLIFFWGRKFLKKVNVFLVTIGVIKNSAYSICWNCVTFKHRCKAKSSIDLVASIISVHHVSLSSFLAWMVEGGPQIWDCLISILQMIANPLAASQATHYGVHYHWNSLVDPKGALLHDYTGLLHGSDFDDEARWASISSSIAILKPASNTDVLWSLRTHDYGWPMSPSIPVAIVVVCRRLRCPLLRTSKRPTEATPKRRTTNTRGNKEGTKRRRRKTEGTWVYPLDTPP